jgi:hypothetical protein
MLKNEKSVICMVLAAFLKLQSFSCIFLLACSSMNLPSLLFVILVAFCPGICQLDGVCSTPGSGVLRWVAQYFFAFPLSSPHLPGEGL